MEKIKFTVGKTATGFDAYYTDDGKIVAITTGDNLSELKNNALAAYNLYAEEKHKKGIDTGQLSFEFDLPSFFEYYNVINARALSARIGMNNALLSHYIKGVKKPSEKQVQKILAGIKDVGKELSELELV
ncbi:MAG: hypothetical protein NVS3B13_40610 [Mucilaginibacter sp.]